MHPFRRPEQHAARRSVTHTAPRTAPRIALCLFAALCCGVPLLQAQSASTGELHLRPRGAGPPLVLDLEALDTGVVQRLTLGSGPLTVEQLAPGPYRITSHVASAAALPFAAAPLQIEIAAQTSLDLVVDRTSGRLQQQPGAAVLFPDSAGVASDQDADGLPSAHGLPDLLNATEIDGVSATQRFHAVPVGSGADPAPEPDADPDSAERTTGPAHGLALGRHAGIAYLFSQAATREFRVQTATYSAQSANTGGAEVNRVSRSGTRGLHAEAFFVLRSSALAATDPNSIATTYNNGVVRTAAVKPHDLGERVGVSLGGPVLPQELSRHRVFYLAAFEAQRRSFPAVASPTDPNFYSLTASQRALLGNRGLSSSKIDAGLAYLSSLTGSVARRSDQDLVFSRLDWAEHPRLTLGLQANLVRWNAPAGLTEAPVVARGRASIGTATGDLAAVLLRVESRFTGRTTNSARLQLLRDTQFEVAQAPLAQEPAVGPGGAPPGVVIGPDGLLFGTPPTLATGALPDERRLEFAEALSLVRGRHALALGGSIAGIHDRSSTTQNAAGTFVYDTTFASGTPGGLPDFLTDYTFNVDTAPNGGCPSIVAATHLFCFQSFTQSFGQQQANFSTMDFAAFAEDTWRPRVGLSLHAGVRYEYTLLPFPVSPNAALDAIFGATAATGVFPEDRNNFGPRLAAAYEPFGPGRGTVRAGYGVFFGRLPGAMLAAALTDTALPSSSVSRLRLTPAAEVTCPSSANGPAQGFGYPCSLLAEPAGIARQTSSAVVFDRHFRLPTVQQGSVTLERGFGAGDGRIVLSAGYLFNLDRQLPGSTDLNIAPSTATATFQLQGGTGAAGVRDGERFVLPL